MFRLFHKNKLKYNEGQLAPFFIAILAVLIILALISINLGKEAFIRTDSTNAVDSGALSAGSMMANVFNALASANAVMEEAYWTFYASISISFAIALWQLATAYAAANAALASAGTALGLACPCPCCAIGPEIAAIGSTGAAIAAITWFIATTWAITIAVTAYYVAQLYYYGVIRRNTREGREGAIGGGHSYTFTNSGIASKLKEGAPPNDVTDPRERRNYRDEFNEFLDGIHDDVEAHHPHQHYAYDWEDGQERVHNVEVDVSIDDVESYDLQVAILPFAAEIALLAVSLSLAYSALTSLTTAETLYTVGLGLLIGACACMVCCCALQPECCACWAALCVAAIGVISAGMGANSAAIASMTPIFYLMAAAWAGLLPGPVVRSNTDWDAFPWIICWIDDIIHDREVRVDIVQQHEGADLGLWQTRYPDIQSYSLVSFEGDGEIHPPELRHDASIIETD